MAAPPPTPPAETDVAPLPPPAPPPPVAPPVAMPPVVGDVVKAIGLVPAPDAPKDALVGLDSAVGVAAEVPPNTAPLPKPDPKGVTPLAVGTTDEVGVTTGVAVGPT